MKKLLTLALLFVLCFSASAQTSKMEFSYCNDNSQVTLFGSGRKETYDVAIRLNSSELVGTTVEGICVYIPKSENLKDYSVWMSKSLTLDASKVNQPDICSQEADLSKAFNEEVITFDQPYTITDEGVFVGYSFTVTAYDSATAAPLPICNNTAPGGFYIHTSKKYLGWLDKVEDLGNLAFSVILGNVPDNGASISVAKKIYTVRGEQTTADVTVLNHGAQGVKSLELAYTYNGETHTQPVTLSSDKVVPGRLGASTTYSLVLPAIADDGEYPLNVSIAKVNGETNGYAGNTASATIDVRAFVPRRRVLFEEYTGTWCTNCPRGNGAIKALKRLHPDDFIPLAYHNGDAMEVMEASSFPKSISSFPASTIDRGNVIDPYYGSQTMTSAMPISFYINNDVMAEQATYAQANVEASAVLSADGSTVTVSSNAIFPRKASSAVYKMEYILLANGLQGTGERWEQINGLSGADAQYFPEPEFEEFLNGPKTLKGFIFDDVVIATTRLTGDDAYLPTKMEANTPYPGTATFSLSAMKADGKGGVLQDLTKLDVVAVLINDYTSEVVNAALAKVDATDYVAAGVKSVVTDGSAAVGVEYTDLSGRSISKPGHGVFIQTTRYANGTAVSRKTVR